MNKVILIGRLTRDPDIRYPQNDGGVASARYTLAVDRRYKKDAEQTADFISCVAFGKGAEFVDKYLRKGSKIAISGRIQTGRYINREGQTIYTTDVVVDEHEFAESKNAGSYEGTSQQAAGLAPAQTQVDENGFINIPEDIDEDLPFK